VVVVVLLLSEAEESELELELELAGSVLRGTEVVGVLPSSEVVEEGVPVPVPSGTAWRTRRSLNFWRKARMPLRELESRLKVLMELIPQKAELKASGLFLT
jgi:hypothetical protein